MEKFEKLAMQLESIGDVLDIPEVHRGVERITKEEPKDDRRAAIVFKMVGAAMRKKPEAMKFLAALEKDIEPDEVDGLEENELIPALMSAFSHSIVPFFAQRKQPEEIP